MNSSIQATPERVDEATLAQRCAEAMWANDHASQGLGMQLEEVRPRFARVRMPVRRDMVNGHATCHGGFIFTLADSAFAFACNWANRVTVASGASIDFVSPARLGDVLTATAEEVSRAGRTGVYDVRVENQHAQLIAVFRGKSHTIRGELIPGLELEERDPTP